MNRPERVSIRDIPVVPRKRAETYGTGLDGQPVNHWIIDCPYCGREHSHSAEPGHRVSHCYHRASDPGYFIEHPADDDDNKA